jgi:hypothetical protein
VQQLLEVQETERRHLARELHDEVMQTWDGVVNEFRPVCPGQPTISSNLSTSMAWWMI